MNIDHDILHHKPLLYICFFYSPPHMNLLNLFFLHSWTSAALHLLHLPSRCDAMYPCDVTVNYTIAPLPQT